MSLIRTLITASVLSVSFNASAALTSYTGAGGVGLVYSSVNDVTWMQDANLFKTLYDADNTTISKIASVTPVYNDTSTWGSQVINSNKFNIEMGAMAWWAANAFVSYLNSIDYSGSNQWRLPSAGSNPEYGYNQIGSELGQLYYNDLSALAYPGSNGGDFGILADGTVVTSGPAGPYLNVQTYGYWTGTEFSPEPS